DYWSDPRGARATAFDVSTANALQTFSVGADGNVVPLFDFLLQPEVRIIGQNTDLFTFEDFSPPAAPRYFERGAVDGQITPASPVSTSAGAGAFAEDMAWLVGPKLAPNDSPLRIQYADPPGAVFDILQVSEGTGVVGNGQTFSFERRLRGIPSPFLPG